MTLHSVPFASSSRLEEIDRGGRVMVRGEHGVATGLLQAGLVDLGFKLPFSIRPSGALDGVFGKETETAIRRFQEKNGLRVDGKVGSKTIRQMDAALLAKATPPPPPPPPPARPPAATTYRLGTADPPLSHDPGAGTWNSKPTTARMLTLRDAFSYLLWPAAYEFAGPDATRNLRHYFDNDGKDWSVDLDKMIREVPSARGALGDEVARAKSFAETLGPGTYDIVSATLGSGYDLQRENKNWFLAVGGYACWGKGHLVVTETAGVRYYELAFEYKFYDRYNWDEGKSTDISMPRALAYLAQGAGAAPGQHLDPNHSIHITDELMGEFQREGLAREYDEYGLAKRQLGWNKGESIPDVQIARPPAVPGGRN
jgi:putative peptidoglycan binding protein